VQRLRRLRRLLVAEAGQGEHHDRTGEGHQEEALFCQPGTDNSDRESQAEQSRSHIQTPDGVGQPLGSV
jgi:hypothetical protein